MFHDENKRVRTADPTRLIDMTKTQIINEIKRTAASNGGIPLGWRKFATETGIREPDWKGKLWARWSDAVREAGFTPNEMKEAYGESELLDKFAKLALELGHVPTVSDIRLCVSQGQAFPNWKTLMNQFGGKPQLVAKLREYCQARIECASVVALCDSYVPQGGAEPDEPTPGDTQIGYVYLIKHGTRREYRIGCTKNVLRREGAIAIELPENIQPIHVITTDDPFGIEAYWHKRFAGKRKNGDWFELNAIDINVFKRRKFM